MNGSGTSSVRVVSATAIAPALKDPTSEDHRYDLVYYGLEPGGYDLRDFLRRKDGSG